MAQPTADRSQFYFSLEDGTELDVVSFRDITRKPAESAAATDFLLQDYRLAITVLRDMTRDPAHYIGTKGKLQIATDDNPVPIHATVTQIIASEIPTCDSWIVAAPLSALKLPQQSQVFADQTLPEIIEHVLQSVGFTSSDYQLLLSNNYSKYSQSVQHNETAVVFLRRLLSEAGLFYSYLQQDNQAILQISDSLNLLTAAYPTASLLFQPSTGQAAKTASVLRWHPHPQNVIQAVTIGDYNPHQAINSLEMSDENFAAAASVSGTHYHEPQAGQQDRAGSALRLRQRQEQASWRAQLVTAVTNYPGLMAGQTVTITGAPDPGGSYVILEILQYGEQSATYRLPSTTPLTHALTYSNTLTLLPLGTPYRAVPLKPADNRLSAGIITNDDDQAVDHHGAYPVRLTFDEGSANKNTAKFAPRRLLQGHANDEQGGWHFPLRKDTRVFLGNVEGNADRLLAFGIYSDPAMGNPVTGNNAWQQVLRTHGDHTLLWNGTPQSEQFALTTPNTHQQLRFDNQSTAPKTRLIAQKGTFSVRSGGSQQHASEQDTQLRIAGNHINSGVQGFDLATDQGIAAYQTSTLAKLGTDQELQLATDQQVLELQSQANLLMGVPNSLSNQSATANAELQTAQSTWQFNGQTGDWQSTTGLTFQNGSAAITCNSDGSVTVTASHIQCLAQQLSLPAQQQTQFES